ncbi:RHS repeat-associated core domain-containing protein [Hymenobacter terrenus]
MRGADGLTRRYERDAAGRVSTVHRPAGRTTTYGYDAGGRVAAVAHDDEAPLTYAYDAAGALLEAHTPTTSVRFERDALGRVVREQQGTHTIDYAYDARGQRTGLHSSLGAAFAWQHDAIGHLAGMQAGERWQAQLVHDARGLEVQRQLSGGLRLDWQHDAAGRPTSQRVDVGAQPVRQRRYQWQGADQLTAIEDSLTGTTRYTYDALGALTGARYADGSQDLRLADAVGNLFRSPTLDDRQYAPGGQLRQAGGTTYRYDAEGNRTSKTTRAGQTWRYAWDGAGQLSSVTLPSGYAVTFAYDALGRRVRKRYWGRVTRWVWDGDVPLHEWSELELGPGAGQAENVATWLFEENSFAPAAKLTAQSAYSVVADHLGTPLELYDSQGTKTWQAQLDSYGAVRQGQGKPQDCPFRYQGQYEDVETGLYYNRFRYYDPETGQYISQDPIRLAGGNVLYAYVDNPTSWIDAYGLACSKPNRRQALNLAKDRAGIPRSQQPETQWEVGNNVMRRGMKNYNYSENPTEHGRFYEYRNAQGEKRVVVEHTNDPRGPHTHAGMPKDNAKSMTYDFKAERYRKIDNPDPNSDGDHHIDYK